MPAGLQKADEEAAKVYEEFVESFKTEEPSRKSGGFVRGGTVLPGSKPTDGAAPYNQLLLSEAPTQTKETLKLYSLQQSQHRPPKPAWKLMHSSFPPCRDARIPRNALSPLQPPPPLQARNRSNMCHHSCRLRHWMRLSPKRLTMRMR